MEKTKNICEGHAKILVCTTKRLNILKFYRKHSKLKIHLTSSILEKPRHITFFKILRLNFPNHHFARKAAFLCPSARKILSNPRPNNVQPENLEDPNKNFLFWLRVWLFGGLAKTSLNKFEQKPAETLQGN